MIWTILKLRKIHISMRPYGVSGLFYDTHHMKYCLWLDTSLLPKLSGPKLGAFDSPAGFGSCHPPANRGNRNEHAGILSAKHGSLQAAQNEGNWRNCEKRQRSKAGIYIAMRPHETKWNAPLFNICSIFFLAKSVVRCPNIQPPRGWYYIVLRTGSLLQHNSLRFRSEVGDSWYFTGCRLGCSRFLNAFLMIF